MEALGLMAGGIAHDFNNLLGAVLGNAELAIATVSANSETHQIMHEIITASSRATDLCHQMPAYAGQGIISLQSLDFNRLIQ